MRMTIWIKPYTSVSLSLIALLRQYMPQTNLTLPLPMQSKLFDRQSQCYLQASGRFVRWKKTGQTRLHTGSSYCKSPLHVQSLPPQPWCMRNLVPVCSCPWACDLSNLPHYQPPDRKLVCHFFNRVNCASAILPSFSNSKKTLNSFFSNDLSVRGPPPFSSISLLGTATVQASLFSLACRRPRSAYGLSTSTYAMSTSNLLPNPWSSSLTRKKKKTLDMPLISWKADLAFSMFFDTSHTMDLSLDSSFGNVAWSQVSKKETNVLHRERRIFSFHLYADVPKRIHQ